MKLEKFLNAYPVWAAYKLHERLVVPMQKFLKQHDLTFLQSLILTALYFEEKPVSPGDLLTLFGTSLANISHSLKHLRLLGFVERHVDNVDARKTRYVLTAQAKQRLNTIIGLHHDAQECLENELSQSAVASWCEIATKISMTKL